MLPERFVERMKSMLGTEYPAFEDSFEKEKYQALRINTLKDSREPFEGLERVLWAENGRYYEASLRPGRHPYHEAGAYYIQEPSAMAVVPLLGVCPGEKVLDLCAAPGGKSTQIAGYLQGEGLLVANEIHPARAKILSENIERMGVVNACVTNETPDRLAEKFGGYFDRILVDAPCSGEGMFRKNEAACEEWSPENVILCGERQDEILDRGAEMLKPGGRLVYSTCTFAPVENEGSIARFLMRHPEFHLLPIEKEKLGLPGQHCDGRPEWCEEDFAQKDTLRGTLRLWPHLVKGEGHFAAVLEKEGTLSAAGESLAVGGIEKGIPVKSRELADFQEFWKNTGKEEQPGKGIFLLFGENLYLAPENMPALKNLKVLRPGLHLGTFKKGRFEPSHALALALKPDRVKRSCSLEKPEEYLNGQTFSAEGEKGWYLLTVDGYSIGWGKLAGGIMKNHYPKGLRKFYADSYCI